MLRFKQVPADLPALCCVLAESTSSCQHHRGHYPVPHKVPATLMLGCGLAAARIKRDALCRRPHALLTLWPRCALPQTTAPTPGQADKVPLLIPVRMGLLGRDGKELPLKLKG